MKAIILAAGQGKRLRPLTNDKPKCLVKLFGKTLLERQIDTYRECGISEITVITGYKNQMIKIPKIHFIKNENFKTTNMVETLFCAKNNLFDECIVSYGDIIFEREIVEQLIKSKSDFSIIIDKNWQKLWNLRFNNPLDDAESLVLDDDNYINDIGQKVEKLDKIHGQFIGLMKFSKFGIEKIKEFYEKSKKNSGKTNFLNSNLPFELSYMTDFLQGLIREKYRLKAIFIKNGWLELDSIKDYEVYNKLFEEGRLSKFISLRN